MNKFLLIFVICLIISVKCGKNKLADKKTETNGQDVIRKKLQEFFGKYCNETDEKIIQKLEKCDDIQPESMKQIEQDCIKSILGKSGTVSYKDIKMVECNEQLGKKFDDCEQAKMKNMKGIDDPKLADIAKKIMYCGFDCYGISHN